MPQGQNERHNKRISTGIKIGYNRISLEVKETVSPRNSIDRWKICTKLILTPIIIYQVFLFKIAHDT